MKIKIKNYFRALCDHVAACNDHDHEPFTFSTVFTVGLAVRNSEVKSS